MPLSKIDEINPLSVICQLNHLREAHNQKGQAL